MISISSFQGNPNHPALVLALVLATAALAPTAHAAEPSLPDVATPAAAPAASGDAEGAPGPALHERVEHEGLVIEMTVEPVGSVAGDRTVFREGDDVHVRFAVSDTSTGTPMSGLYPAAWMDRVPTRAALVEGPSSCKDKVASFVGGSLLASPELDLNVYYVLALNNDATISVVDPLFGFGTTKLLDMVFLKTPGEDWVLTPDQLRLFVSMPKSDQVAVVDPSTWKVQTNVDVGPTPRRLALQPDGRYLWAAYETARPGREDSGVTVIDARTFEPVADVATGRGEHQVALSADDRWAFVTNSESGTVSIVDVARLEKIRDVPTGPEPVSIAYSPIAGAAYVSHRDGLVAVLDGGGLRAEIRTEAGLGMIRFAPGGRLALVVNEQEDLVHVIDAAVNREIQTADVEDQPDEVAFSDELAYVRHRGSEIVHMIPLGELGTEKALVPVIDFPGGQNPPGRTNMPSLAPGIVQAPGATAVLVSNPLDGAIFYYKEGMAAPMGHFRNYGRQPRAVMVVDRSLRERAPGVYGTTVRLRRPGRYDLAFFLDTPQVVRCFPFAIDHNPELAAAQRRELPAEIEVLAADREIAFGEEALLRVKLTDPRTGEVQAGLEDLKAMTFLVPDSRQQRHLATEVGDGVYEIRFRPPEPGLHYVFFESYSLGLDVSQSTYLSVDARGGESAIAELADTEGAES